MTEPKPKPKHPSGDRYVSRLAGNASINDIVEASQSFGVKATNKKERNYFKKVISLTFKSMAKLLAKNKVIHIIGFGMFYAEVRILRIPDSKNGGTMLKDCWKIRFKPAPTFVDMVKLLWEPEEITEERAEEIRKGPQTVMRTIALKNVEATNYAKEHLGGIKTKGLA